MLNRGGWIGNRLDGASSGCVDGVGVMVAISTRRFPVVLLWGTCGRFLFFLQIFQVAYSDIYLFIVFKAWF